MWQRRSAISSCSLDLRAVSLHGAIWLRYDRHRAKLEQLLVHLKRIRLRTRVDCPQVQASQNRINRADCGAFPPNAKCETSTFFLVPIPISIDHPSPSITPHDGFEKSTIGTTDLIIAMMSVLLPIDCGLKSEGMPRTVFASAGRSWTNRSQLILSSVVYAWPM